MPLPTGHYLKSYWKYSSTRSIDLSNNLVNSCKGKWLNISLCIDIVSHSSGQCNVLKGDQVALSA